jgi:hypothetical protein
MIFWMSDTAIGSMPANGSSSRDELWRDDERSGDFGAPPLAARQRVRRRLRQRRQVQFRQQLAEPRPARRAIEPHCFQDRENVLFHGEPAEDRRLLRQVADALARADVHRIVGDVMPSSSTRRSRAP